MYPISDPNLQLQIAKEIQETLRRVARDTRLTRQARRRRRTRRRAGPAR